MPLFRRPKAKALTAAGVRVVPKMAASLGGKKDKWQKEAWTYRSTVPELRFVGGFVATQLSRVRWFVGEAGLDGHEPRPLSREKSEGDDQKSEISERTKQIAIDALDRLDLNSRGSSMAGRAAENFEYAGECYLLGQEDENGIETWTIRSVSEIEVSREGEVSLIEPGSKSGGQTLDLDKTELFRLWNPDPEYHEWADAKITACLQTLNEITIYDQQLLAAAKSRISSGAVLYVPDELTLTRPGSAPVSAAALAVDDEEDPFMAEFTAAMLNPIMSNDDPSAIVPIILRGPAMIGDRATGDLIKIVQIPREEIADVIKKRDAAVTKLAHGMDIPPEVVTGLGDVNHWTGFVVSDATVKQHLEPRAENFADSVTASYLRDTCRAQDCPAEEVARLCVWFDASELAQPADPMGIAKELHNRQVISDAALRRAGGYGDDDIPDKVELFVRRLSSGSVTNAALPLILALSGLDPDDPTVAKAMKLMRQQAEVQPGTPSVSPLTQLAAPELSERATQESPVPDRKTPVSTSKPAPRVAVTAAASRRASTYKVDERLCRQLGAIDQQVIAELGGFIDAAILDIVRQAANRIRSGAIRASAGAVERDMFPKGCDPVAVVAAAGDRFTWSVPDQQALEGALDRIRPRWLQAVSDAAKQIMELLTRLFGRAPTTDLVTQYERQAEQVWPHLGREIERTAVGVLHGTVEVGDDGSMFPRGALSASLTEVGGLPETSGGVAEDGATAGAQPATGLTAGKSVQDATAEAGGIGLGYEWQWHSHQRTPFPPHVDLSGARFSGFADPKLISPPGYEWVGPHLHPGDHRNCGCSAYLILASPASPDEPRSSADILLSDSPQQARIRALAEDDDRRGLRGALPDGRTYAQRDRDAIDEVQRLRRKHIDDREVA